MTGQELLATPEGRHEASLDVVLARLVAEATEPQRITADVLQAAGWRGGRRAFEQQAPDAAQRLAAECGLRVYWQARTRALQVYPGRWEGRPGGTWRERGADLAEQVMGRLLAAGGVRQVSEVAHALLSLLQEEGQAAAQVRLAGCTVGAAHADSAEVFAGYVDRLRAEIKID